MLDIGIEDLATAIANELRQYNDEVVEKVDKTSIKFAKRAAKLLRLQSPKKSGKYAKAWSYKTEKQYGRPNTQKVYVKAPYYRLTHLLEYGHITPTGGRTEASPHIKPVEEIVKSEFVSGVEEVLSGT